MRQQEEDKVQTDFDSGSVASEAGKEPCKRTFFKQNCFNDTEIKLFYMPHNIQPDKILNIFASKIASFLFSFLSPSSSH